LAAIVTWTAVQQHKLANDIPRYIDGIDKKALEMRSVAKQYEPLPVGQKRSELVKKETHLLGELTDELPRLKEVFAPYLRFDKWK